MTHPDYYLGSTETSRPFRPRKCFVKERLVIGNRDDWALVNIDPPIIGQPYGLGGEDIEQVVLATRHDGFTLWPVNMWPVSVHIARVVSKSVLGTGKATGADVQLIAWGELYSTMAEASAASRRSGSRRESF